MLFLIIFSTAIALAITLPIASTPIVIGIWILLLSILSATAVGLISSSWFAFILFIIYVGGMLVIFSYFSAISPNQHIKTLSSFLVIALIAFSIITLIYTPLAAAPFSRLPHFISQPNFTLLFCYNNLPILMFLAVLLLLAIILVVKLTQRSEGPLRDRKSVV